MQSKKDLLMWPLGALLENHDGSPVFRLYCEEYTLQITTSGISVFNYLDFGAQTTPLTRDNLIHALERLGNLSVDYDSSERSSIAASHAEEDGWFVFDLGGDFLAIEDTLGTQYSVPFIIYD